MDFAIPHSWYGEVQAGLTLTSDVQEKKKKKKKKEEEEGKKGSLLLARAGLSSYL
jgi:hypothetical protein